MTICKIVAYKNKKSLAWAKGTKDTRTDTLAAIIRKRAFDNSVLHKQYFVNSQ